MNEPVAITGIGIICALGSDRTTVTEALRAGRRPFAPVKRFDAARFRVNLAAECADPDLVDRFGKAALRHTSRTDRLALWACADALTQANLDATARRSLPLFVGASTGGMGELEEALARGGRIPLSTYWSYPVWSTASTASRVLGLGGPRATYMTACSSAAHALGVAMQRIRAGELKAAIAGGAEAVSRLTLAGFGALGVLDPAGTRPFDAARAGITLGEGAAFFVLEPLAAAQARGAKPLALLCGYGASADAHHMIHPREDGVGAIAAVQAALADAGVAADEIDYVNAHGTGTTQNDRMEAGAFARLFAGRPVRVSSSKSMIGHTLGAAAALEAAVSVLAMNAGFAPPNPGVSAPTPELSSLALVRQAQGPAPAVILSTSFAFGGNNAALILTSPERATGERKKPSPRAGSPSAPAAVVVSGAALACSQGSGSTAAAIDALAAHAQPTAARELAGLDPGEVLGRAVIRRMDPLSSAVAALASLARRDAGLTEAADAAMTIGTSFGALDATKLFLARLFEKGPTLVNPLEFPNLVHNAPVGHASILLGAAGPNVASCQEELAADEAVRVAAAQVRSRRAKVAIAMGGDLRSQHMEEAYAAVDRALSTQSEHASVAAALVLEEAEACAARGGRPWARLLASASAGPEGGVAGAIARALAQATGRAASFPEAQAEQPFTIDVWYQGATEARGKRHESEACGAIPALAGAERVAIRERLGDAGGAGAAAIAAAAARIALGKTRVALVTSVTRDGSAHATLLEACR